MTARCFVDTNLLVYALDSRDRHKQRTAMNLLGEPREFVISTQVLQELYAVAVGRLKLAHASAEAAVRSAAGTLDVVVLTPDLVLRGIQRVSQSRVSIWDGLIVEAALEAGCTELLTEDLHDGHRFGDLRVVNPFFRGVRDSAAFFAEEAVLAPRAPPSKSRGGARGRRSPR